MTRFIVLRHPATQHRLAIHRFLHGYQGMSLDENHVLVLANFNPRSVDILTAREDVLLLPSVLDPVTVHSHAASKNRAQHFEALRKIGMDETHTTAHLARFAAEKCGLHLDI